MIPLTASGTATELHQMQGVLVDGSTGFDRKFMTGAEVAEMFRTTESTVRYWKYVGKIKAIKIGRRSLYAVEDIEALIKTVA